MAEETEVAEEEEVESEEGGVTTRTCKKCGLEVSGPDRADVLATFKRHPRH